MEPFLNYLNSTIIKSTMRKMNEEEFLQCALSIKKRAIELPFGTKRQEYFNLYCWCRVYYSKKFKKNKPSIFEGL